VNFSSVEATADGTETVSTGSQLILQGDSVSLRLRVDAEAGFADTRTRLGDSDASSDSTHTAAKNLVESTLVIVLQEWSIRRPRYLSRVSRAQKLRQEQHG
jgi:hypothetical protein